MKKIYTIAIVFILGMTLFACQNNKSKNTTGPITTPAQPSGSVSTPSTPTTTSVEHYMCPNGHAGFGGAAKGNCSKCNAVLVHNQAYHNNTASTPTNPVPSNSPTSPVSPIIQTPTAAGGQASPAQNANGVWHYICSSGCTGGAGAKGTCATCGAALAHNQAYHN